MLLSNGDKPHQSLPSLIQKGKYTAALSWRHDQKKNGQILGPYKAKFAGDTIIINDPLADIDDGDIILRRLPNGKDQRSYVTKATFYDTHIGGFGPHFQVKFKSASAVEHPKPVQNIHI
ncbi:MAG: hypothetical protein ACRC64_02395, partial [Plesiomonas shigelloides]